MRRRLLEVARALKGETRQAVEPIFRALERTGVGWVREGRGIWAGRLAGAREANAVDVISWAYEAQCGLQKAEGESRAARSKAWKDWVAKAEKGGRRRLGTWVKEESAEPILSVVSKAGGVI